jgi:AmmeMemoRadiSam system protein B
MQPRLDWMMRFAALQPARACGWFPGFIDKLLAGSPAVLRLLESNPCPDHSPRYIRADVYRYAFTTQNERANTGDWWKRNLVARFTDARARQALPALASDSFKADPSRADLMLWDGKRYERFAGSWYPASAEELKRSIETYQGRAAADAENRARRIAQFCGTRPSESNGLSDLSESRELGNVGDPGQSVGIGEPIALFVPHAAFGFSGLNTAAAYARFSALSPKRIILLGPYHYHDRPGDSGGECGALLSEDRVFSTPLGDLPVDYDAVRALSKCAYFAQNDRSHRREHSLEMQLPFIRHTFGAVTIVPILIANLNNPQQAKSIGQSISAMMRPGDLIIASCDMTHYGRFYGFAPYQDRMKEHVLELDQQAYSFVRKHDVDGLWRFHEESRDYMCGFPVMAVLMSILPADSRATVLDYYTSQDSDSRFKPCEQERCVGYLSAVFLRQQQHALKLGVDLHI